MAATVYGAPAHVGHSYVPRDEDEPWGLCHCGLAQAAHVDALYPYESPSGLPYRCHDCVKLERATCDHARPGETEIA